MQSKGFIKLVAVALAIACIYQLSFTFMARGVENKAAKYAAQFAQPEQDAAQQRYLDSVANLPVADLGIMTLPSYKVVKSRELNLGLDLKGGMNVMLEVQVEDLIKALAGNNVNDPNFVQAIEQANAAMKDGSSRNYVADFVSAYEQVAPGEALAAIFVSPDRSDITLETSNSDLQNILESETEAAIEASFNVLRSRIDHFGVVQPNIMRLPNSHRILVELPGVKEPQRVRDLLQGTASLEFWLTYNANEVFPALIQADQVLSEEIKSNKVEETVTEEVVQEPAADGDEIELIDEIESTSTPTDAASIMSKENNPLFSILDAQFAGGSVVGAAYKANIPQIDEYLSRQEIKDLLPADVFFRWSAKGDERIDNRYYLYALRVTTADGTAPLDGGYIVDARQDFSQMDGSTPIVSMTMNSDGAKEWAKLTGENIGNSIAIVLDGYVYSAPNVNSKIENGSSEISGAFTVQEAVDLANVLKSGKVPAPSRIINDTVVGPSLGQESINAGMISFIIAFILVMLYMGLFYRGAGWLADLALITNIFLLMGILVSYGAVLTLPGIAGIVLTMGMAVDANVIIYERIKEELRDGTGIQDAIKNGFKKAYTAIIDGNLTTIITGIVLSIFGSGPVKGFATTLIIGIITSFLSAIFITRLLIEWRVSRKGSISFSRKWSENFLGNTKIDFVGKRKKAYITMFALIGLSILSLSVRQLNLGAEFTGGRAYVVRFDQEVATDEARQNLENEFAQIADSDAANTSFEVKQYGGGNEIRIVTQYKYDDTSDTATQEVEELIYNALAPLFGYEITFENFRDTQHDENGIQSTDMVGPSIAKDMTWNAIYSVLLSLIAIGLYITFRFKRWQWATGATAALAFNTIFVIGIFSMFYGLLPFNLEVNQAFIAAILTIIGYSINDTVVVFDRIREYLGLYPKRDFKETINGALNSTLSRTINTSCTTLVTLLAIFIFGGATIRGFVFALIFGVIVGTASSLFIATPIAYSLVKRSKK